MQGSDVKMLRKEYHEACAHISESIKIMEKLNDIQQLLAKQTNQIEHIEKSLESFSNVPQKIAVIENQQRFIEQQVQSLKRLFAVGGTGAATYIIHAILKSAGIIF